MATRFFNTFQAAERFSRNQLKKGFKTRITRGPNFQGYNVIFRKR